MKIKDERKVYTYELGDVEIGQIVEIDDAFYIVTEDDRFDAGDNKLILVVELNSGCTVWMHADTAVNLVDATLTVKKDIAYD